jgi:hypothetical protein
MINNKQKYKKAIELFHEKSGEVVRVIRFKKSKDFDYFLYAFRSMRYPGYNWRNCNNTRGRREEYHAEKN